MSFLLDNVEYITEVYSTINCFAPALAFYDSIKSKNYNAVTPNSYILQVAMNFSWLMYAIRTNNDILYSVSLQYVVILCVYSLISIFLTKSYSKIIHLLVLVAIEYYVINLLQINQLGLACTFVQFISDSQQWETIIATLKVKNPTFVNIKSKVVTLISCFLWTIIGLKSQDSYLIFPNGYNVILHVVLIIMAVYYQLNQNKKNKLK